MKKLLKHKGFTGSVDIDLDDMSLRGKILFISDLVTYEASTVKEINAEFCAAVEDYLDTCRQLDREPMKPCSGTFNVRIGAELHQRLAIYSTLNGESINNLVKLAIERFLNDPEQKAVVHNHFHEAPKLQIKADYTYDPAIEQGNKGAEYAVGLH